MKKKVLIGLLSIIIVLLIVLMFFGIYQKNHKMTKLEKMYVSSMISDNTSYINLINEKDKNNRCILYAMYHNYLENDSLVLSTRQIANICNEHFNRKYQVSELDRVGINATLTNAFINENNDLTGYELVLPKENYRSIPLIKINLYQINNIKRNKNDYIVTYDQYEISDPYQILNYYTSLKNQDEEFINIINNYLSGDLFQYKFIDYLKEQDIKKYSKKTKKQVKVTYTIKAEKLVIK